MADGAQELVAGALDGLGGVEVGGCGGELVESAEGDAGPEEGFGVGQGLEALVGCGDILLPVAPSDAAGGAGDLGGEEAGPVEVEEGAEVVVEEGVDPVVGFHVASVNSMAVRWPIRRLLMPSREWSASGKGSRTAEQFGVHVPNINRIYWLRQRRWWVGEQRKAVGLE